jgi:hypothetical protein
MTDDRGAKYFKFTTTSSEDGQPALAIHLRRRRWFVDMGEKDCSMQLYIVLSIAEQSHDYSSARTHPSRTNDSKLRLTFSGQNTAHPYYLTGCRAQARSH